MGWRLAVYRQVGIDSALMGRWNSVWQFVGCALPFHPTSLLLICNLVESAKKN